MPAVSNFPLSLREVFVVRMCINPYAQRHVTALAIPILQRSVMKSPDTISTPSKVKPMVERVQDNVALPLCFNSTRNLRERVSP
jgi:hypothetical protein